MAKRAHRNFLAPDINLKQIFADTLERLGLQAVYILAHNDADADGLAALGVIGDIAESCGFPDPEINTARAKYGITALRKTTALINQPRRSANGDAYRALSLLQKSSAPKDVLSGQYPETRDLIDAKHKVKTEASRRGR